MITKQIEEIKSLIEKVVDIPFPPVLGKIEKVYEISGKSDFLNCIYSADVRLIELTENGNFKDSNLVIPDVPILSIGVGNNRGIYFLPEKGSIVKVSFLYGCLSYPVIDGILPYRKTIPKHQKDNLVINVPNNKEENIKNLWQGNYNKVELLASSGFYLTGNVYITGNVNITGNASITGTTTSQAGFTSSGAKTVLMDDFVNIFNTHNHNGDSGGTTSTPNQTI